MGGDFSERRRHVRVELSGRPEFQLGRRLRVRLIDISGNGALLAADEPMPVGAKGRLQLVLDGHAFEAHVEVVREQLAPDGRRFAGIVMTTVERAHQDALEELLRRAGS